MDTNLQSSPSDSADAKAAFRKPSNDAVHRKYRRRSPVGGSSSSDDSANRGLSASPTSLKEDPAKVFYDRRRREDGRDSDRDYGRGQYSRRGVSHRHSDRQSSRNSHNYHRHDDYTRHDRHVDEDERTSSKLSSRSGRESRVDGHSDRAKKENEHNGLKDHLHNVDKYSRDKFDEDRDYRRSLGDRKSDRSPVYEESRGHRSDSTSRRDSSGHRLKEASRSDSKELESLKYTKEEKKKYDDWETKKHKERYNREPGEQFEDRTAFSSEGQESPAKRSKFSSLDRDTDRGKDVSKFTSIADERQSLSSKQTQEFVSKVTSEQDYVKDSDIDAAKVAAMKAAELVNRNLVGTGFMSTDQKKKLLWGSKKNTTTEEPAHRWDASLFSDRERQEKFNKLMGVKGEVKVENKLNNQDAEKQKELQLDLEKQYTAGLRRRDGRTVGLGL